MTTLKQALEAGKLDQFIAEHDGEKGDEAALTHTLRSMAGMLKAVPKPSGERGSDD